MGTDEFNAGDSPVMDLHPIQGGGLGVEILLVASCYNWDKLQPGGSQLAPMQTFMKISAHFALSNADNKN